MSSVRTGLIITDIIIKQSRRRVFLWRHHSDFAVDLVVDHGGQAIAVVDRGVGRGLMLQRINLERGGGK
jgi:hypothetical protein